MKNYLAKSVDEYIAKAPAEAQAKLLELRAVIKSAAPKAVEGISWGIPFYKHEGLLGGFATFKSHVGFGFCTVIPTKERAALEKKGYSSGKKTIQIKFDQQVPTVVIRRILKTVIKTNEQKKAAKSKG